MPTASDLQELGTVDDPQVTIKEEAEPDAKRLFRLFRRITGTTLDVGLLVVGTALVSLAIVVLLDGFEILEVGLTKSTGEMLGSGLVIAVFGAFALGVAVEGPIRALRTRTGTEIEMLLIRAGSLLLVGGLLLFVGRFIEPYLEDLPSIFGIANDVLVATGVAGLTATLLLGATTLWGIRRLYLDKPWLDLIELPLLYSSWVIGTVIVFNVMFVD
ncbi:MAG: hypothetical protein OEM81_00265 [Acidimicrobiia bacterium]|nr:hypothetical protein [Acidimicrobiia bacterium]MDH3396244.1 hypothetical protein [Acidimicrobiia bacterium]